MAKNIINKENYHFDINISHNKNLNFKMPNPHFHDGFELQLLLSDGVTYIIDGNSYLANTGTLTAINQDEIHFAKAPSEYIYERFVLSFKPSFILELSATYPELLSPFTSRKNGFLNCVQLTKVQLSKMINLMQQLHLLVISEDSYSPELNKKILLSQILVFASEIYSLKFENLNIEPFESDVQINKIISYIKENYAEDLSLKTLSAIFFISKSNLIVSFKHFTSMTPTQYIIMYRVMKSREFLNKGLPLSKVCELIGYSDESSFIRTFKKIIGCTPKSYKKNKVNVAHKFVN